MSFNWDFAEVTDRLAAALTGAEESLRLEQAVYGLDSRDERALQELLANRISWHYSVAREVPYPSSLGKKLSHRQRCDLVLTPKGRDLRIDSAPPNLFTPTDLCGPEEALWLEIKIAYQFREGNIPHTSYGSQWRTAIIQDLRKMEAEEKIREAALILIVFNQSQEVLDKDLDLFETAMIEKEVLAGFRQVRTIPITERIGHTLCTLALWPTIQR